MVTKKYAIDFHMSDGSVKSVEFEVPQADLDKCVLRDGSNPMTADLPMGGHRVTGLGKPVADGDAVPLGYANGHFAPAVESAEYPGCYYRAVNGVVEWLNPPMIPGVEYRTTERWNGKAVLTQMIETNALVDGHNLVTFSNVWSDEVVDRIIKIGSAFNVPTIYGSLDNEYSAYDCTTKSMATIDVNLFVGSAHVGKTAKVQVWYTRD